MANRLSTLAEKYRQVAEMAANAEANPLVGLDRENLLMEAETELKDIDNLVVFTAIPKALIQYPFYIQQITAYLDYLEREDG